VRLPALVECGTKAMIGAVFDSFAVGERTNGDFEDYWRYHGHREHQRLYPVPPAGIRAHSLIRSYTTVPPS
jgi:hypothetical protein